VEGICRRWQASGEKGRPPALGMLGAGRGIGGIFPTGHVGFTALHSRLRHLALRIVNDEFEAPYLLARCLEQFSDDLGRRFVDAFNDESRVVEMGKGLF